MRSCQLSYFALGRNPRLFATFQSKNSPNDIPDVADAPTESVGGGRDGIEHDDTPVSVRANYVA